MREMDWKDWNILFLKSWARIDYIRLSFFLEEHRKKFQCVWRRLRFYATRLKQKNETTVSNLVLPCGRCGYYWFSYRRRKQRYLALVPIRPNPLTGGFSSLHVGWVDKQRIVLEFLYFQPFSDTCDHLLSVTNPNNKLFWLRTCSPTVILSGVIKTRPQIRLHHSINSYESEMKLSFKSLYNLKIT